MPATGALEAAHAYEMIVKAVANASDATDQAKDLADSAASMVRRNLQTNTSCITATRSK